MLHCKSSDFFDILFGLISLLLISFCLSQGKLLREIPLGEKNSKRNSDIPIPLVKDHIAQVFFYVKILSPALENAKFLDEGMSHPDVCLCNSQRSDWPSRPFVTLIQIKYLPCSSANLENVFSFPPFTPSARITSNSEPFLESMGKHAFYNLILLLCLSYRRCPIHSHNQLNIGWFA